MLNKGGPKIEHCGTPGKIFPCKRVLFWVFVFDSESNLEIFSKQEVTIHKHVVLQLVNHGK